MPKPKPSPELIVPPERAGERLDRLVVDLPEVGSRRRARQAIETGKVSLNGQVCKPDDAGVKVPAGARLSITWGKPGTGRVKHQARKGLNEVGLHVLFEDEWIVAVDKPAGLLTDTATRQQSMHQDSMRSRLGRYLRSQGDAIHVVHRIDRDTSGVVLAARTEQVSRELRRQFRKHLPERRYLAVVHGVPEPAEGEWRDWMTWDPVKRIQRTTPPETEGATHAGAQMRTIATYGRYAALIELRLITGRRNQIRLQAQLRGHPLLGEKLYLPEDWRAPARALIHRQALHALSLEVLHPRHRSPQRFEAKLPKDFRQLLAVLERRHGQQVLIPLPQLG
jgi:23S rRNA pseudouridine1911/1915/1917 synthase